MSTLKAHTCVRFAGSDNSFHNAVICRLGRTKAHLVWIGNHGVKASAEPTASVAKYSTAIDYPVKKAARRILKAGRALGITKAAKRLLREVLK